MSNETIDLLTQSNWHCLDCGRNRDLNRRGECEVCLSNAVIDMSLSAYNPNNTVEMELV